MRGRKDERRRLRKEGRKDDVEIGDAYCAPPSAARAAQSGAAHRIGLQYGVPRRNKLPLLEKSLFSVSHMRCTRYSYLSRCPTDRTI